jgi:hypothetical protein
MLVRASPVIIARSLVPITTLAPSPRLAAKRARV